MKRKSNTVIASLFDEEEQERLSSVTPLAVRMRPRSLEEIVGQQQAVGPGSWLRAAIEQDTLSSVILFGPAGTGKTSIAHVIAESTEATFVEVSAIGGTVADLRREITAAEQRLRDLGQRSILFVDEIHRFNRSQQDALLHAVEDSIVTLVGATTENPFFEVNTALLSRSRVVELRSLGDGDIATLIGHALEDERGLGGRFSLSEEALSALIIQAGGDGRAALSSLEIAAELARAEVAGAGDGAAGDEAARDKAAGDEAGRDEASGSQAAGDKADRADSSDASSSFPSSPGIIPITAELVQRANPRRALPYDKNKDMHYDIISAFIKSMRGSDPDAALYWLARMIDGGEDPKFIARRMFIAASEDIGNADPNALLVAEAAFRAAEVIGYPECRINLAQAAIYLALAPKSNAVITGIDRALSEVRKGPARAVPDHLRDRHRPGSEEYGRYKYPHSYPGGWVEQQYLPDGLKRGCFYEPGERGWEAFRAENSGIPQS